MSSEPPYLRVGALSRRVGVTPELLRAWEQRYGLLRPRRSAGGFRLYSRVDEERVREMRRHLAAGVAAAVDLEAFASFLAAVGDLPVDCILEVKDKERSVLRARASFGRGSTERFGGVAAGTGAP